MELLRMWLGDALTFWIWTEDTEKLIARSVIRSAEDPETPNKRLDQVIPDTTTSSDPTSLPMDVIGTKDLLLI